ncbi:hypothetical protein [Flavobacterium agrisoli]|uniref:Secreted protein n=1 Tax=Flavobacterium agrisoli TaxID=2793066 RepID=A0A934PL27_9FLAO|nr:hypothetical protein [Flavobacterium agrisoli]MBK0369265.1 hypothetical protein [Flavobacterium agrisoli]
MKKIAFILIGLGSICSVAAQDELNKNFKPIPPKKANVEKGIPPQSQPQVIDSVAVAPNPNPLYVNPDELFKDTNKYKKESNSAGVLYRRNQFLGNFTTNSFTSTVRFRDAAFVDGDKVRVLLNDKVVSPETSLESDFESLKLDLVPGVNKIDIEALNEGFAAPNTAELQIYDDKGKAILVDQWNVGTGYKATIVIIRE